MAVLVIAISMGYILIEKPAFKGKVSTSGKPINDIDVTIKKVPGYEIFSRTMTDGRGNFNFSDVPEGNFVVEISYFPINGPGGDVSGRLYYFDDPLDDAVIKIFNEENQLIETINTDRSGRFSASNLPAAEIKLIVDGMTGYTPAGP